MATKSCCPSLKNEHQQNFASNQDSQFRNLNLNQHNYQESNEVHSVHSKSISFDDKRIHENDILCNNLKNDSFSKNKWDNVSQPFSSEPLKLHDSRKEKKSKESDSSVNRSTLSLHIAAYEDSIEASNDNFQDEITEKHVFGSSWENVKELFNGSSTKGMFEIPRQQKDESTPSKPEVMEFKASQKLLNPNQEIQSSSKASAGSDASESSFEKLKAKANIAFKTEKYKEAIEIYNEMLQLHSLNEAKKAFIYSNKSAANLMLKDGKSSLEEAKEDAMAAIKCRPNWWKGYYRLGRAQAESEEWEEAEKMLEKALALDSTSYEIRDELSNVRAQLGIRSRQDHPDPSFYAATMEEQMSEACSRLGINKVQMNDLLKKACEKPEIKDLLQGNAYRDGNGVKRDLVKAAKFYAKAAEKDNPDAMYNLGKMYNYGEGVKRDYEKSMFWLLKAANSKSLIMPGSGIPEAQHAIGLKYAEGTGVEKDYQKAAEWYEKAAKNGSGQSANNLALLYKEGLGVEKSEAKASEYFKYAAQQSGDSAAMTALLAECYLYSIGTKKDVSEGMKWQQTTADKGDPRTEGQIRIRKYIGSDESKSEFSNDKDESLPFYDEQNENDDGYSHLGDMAFKVLGTEDKNYPLNYEEYGKCVKEAAAKGSKTAQRHMEIWKNMNDAMEAFKKNNPAELVAALSKAIRLCYDTVDIPDLFKPVIIKRFKSHPNELDTIICYTQTSRKNPELKNIAQKYNKMFPEEIYLWEMVIATYMSFEQNVNAAFKTVKMALKRFPTCPLMMYSYAILLHLQDKPECIQAFDAYLAVVPEDNEKVPATHYQKAQYYITVFDIPNALASIKAGEAAEKKQLACFLPYEKNGFYLMKPMLNMFYARHMPANPQAESSPLNLRLEQIKNDPRRKIYTLKNREHFIKMAEIYGAHKLTWNETVPNVPHKPAPPNWASTKIKKISGKDMDPTKDKVYNGCILEGRIIDWAFLMASIATNIEDENGDIHRFVIYRWPLPNQRDPACLEGLKVFRPNVKISIINPYHRKARDGHNTIRVEGPEYVKLNTSMIDKQCHVCGKEGKALPSCSQCKMALYCSKECQTFDWVELNHRGICKYLKMFSRLI